MWECRFQKAVNYFTFVFERRNVISLALHVNFFETQIVDLVAKLKTASQKRISFFYRFFHGKVNGTFELEVD